MKIKNPNVKILPRSERAQIGARSPVGNYPNLAGSERPKIRGGSPVYLGEDSNQHRDRTENMRLLYLMSFNFLD